MGPGRVGAEVSAFDVVGWIVAFMLAGLAVFIWALAGLGIYCFWWEHKKGVFDHEAKKHELPLRGT
jgi:nitrogen fixation-related uncharacterized protein